MRFWVWYSLRRFWSATLLLLLPPGIYAQQTASRLYNVNDGLPASWVYNVYQDKYHYLWISTSAGISRFDGRQFTNYSIEDGLQSVGCPALQDSHERLWIATAAGMEEFKNNRFITYPTSDRMTNTYVFNFFETNDKKIWALTGSGVYEFAGNMWKKIVLCPGLENRPCRNIVEKNGELFINYTDDIVCRDMAGKWLRIASHAFFNNMILKGQNLWVSTISNIYEIRNHQLAPLYKNGLGNKGFFSYLFDSQNRIWIARGKSLLTSAPGKWQQFSKQTSNSGYYSFVKEDSSQNIWTGTTAGLLKIKDIDFEAIDKNNTAPLDGIYNIISLPDNRLLFSSGSKTGLLLYENNKCRQLAPPFSSHNKNYYRDPVDAYTFDDRNTLWMLTRFRKLLHFNGKTLEDFSKILNLKTTENVYDMTFATKRKQFFICADSTLLYGTSAKLATFIPHNTGVAIIKPTRVRELKNGLLLLYVDGLGVYCIDESNNFISLIKQTGIDGSKKGVQLPVLFFEGANDSFWIAVPGLGLYEYDFTKGKRPFLKTHITVADGLQSARISSMASDQQNRLWLSTSTGLDILQKNKAGRWEVFNYAKAVDIGVSECDFDRLAADKKGNIWLSSPNRVIKINTANIRLHKEIPGVIIEKVSLAFRETDWSKITDSLYSYYQLPFNPVLNYGQNSLGVFFNAIDLSVSNSSPEYSYKLLPVETSWSIPTKTKSVSFAQLPAGKYKFMVRAKDRASGWSRPAIFTFTITPPFWDRWWFRVVIIIIASCIIIGIFKARIKKIERDAFIENQLRELEMKALKAQMNPHFIYNALNSIQALVANDKKAEGIYYIGSFSRLLRQVLDNSENNVIGVDKELETIGLYIQLEALRLDMQLQYKKVIAENIVTEFEKIPPLILQPFIENALWHGLSTKQGEKEIQIAVSLAGNWLICDITDNGIGREKAQELKNNALAIHHSKGIDITRKRLIDYNDDNLVIPIEFFDLYDDEKCPAGTRVTVRIKRKFNSPAD